MMADVSEKSSKLSGYIQILEDELTKIHAFKRELPLCMLLLNDAIQRLKEQTKQYERTEVRRGTEEFMPLVGNPEKNGGTKASSDFSDKKNWLRSAQLWSTSDVKRENNCRYTNEQVTAPSLELRDKEEDGSATGNLFQLCKFRNSRGAFEPFRRTSALVMREDKAAEMGSIDLNLEGNTSGSDSSSVTDQMKPQSKTKQQQKQQQQKKQRRCWSSELHRRFVDALQQLGGPQSATPKHIRELMQVDGLTNDEKYRMHVKKLSVSSSLPTTSAVPVLGTSLDQCGDVLKANPSQSGSPPSP